MARVTAVEKQGIIWLSIPVIAYGDAGEHWRDTLSRPNRQRFGKIYLQRHNAARRRYIHTYPLKGIYHGWEADLDECPGAMFVWTGLCPASVEGVSPHHNRALGSDIMRALRPFTQNDPSDLWQMEFKFI